MSEWDFFFGFLTGYAVAYFLPRIRHRIGIVYAKWKQGICFSYQAGPWTTKDGTASYHCLRCGHPAGYHWGDKNINQA